MPQQKRKYSLTPVDVPKVQTPNRSIGTRLPVPESLPGAIQIEAVFSWPGLGGAIFESVVRRDFPVLQGAFLLIAVSVILANLIADLTYSYLDPRVRAE